MRKHIQVLGILNIIWGSFGLIAALIIMAIFGGAMGLIQATSHGDRDAALAIPIVGLVGSLIFIVLFVASIPAVLAGIGLLNRASWSRILTIIVSALHLFSVPFGTALGVYGLWVMLSDDATRLFAPNSPPVRI